MRRERCRARPSVERDRPGEDIRRDVVQLLALVVQGPVERETGSGGDRSESRLRNIEGSGKGGEISGDSKLGGSKSGSSKSGGSMISGALSGSKASPSASGGGGRRERGVRGERMKGK
jgi:hypothetical protein